MTEYEVSKTGLPAERLLAAADLLDKRAGEATAGPWVEAGIGDYGWSVIAADHGRNFGIETEDSEQGKADAAYIAAMNPLVGGALAHALRTSARITGLREGRGDRPDRAARNLLKIADLLLAGES